MFATSKLQSRLVKVRGEYSEEALLAELEGTVTVAATIAVDGSVRDSRVIGRLGIGLDEMARAAAERWSFEPGETESGKAPMLAIMDLEFLLPLKQSRWHLLGLSFNTPQGASQPRFLKVIYPSGDGIGQDTSDVSRAIAVLRSQALVVLRFDVNEAGRPVRFRVQKASEIGRGNDAISIVSRWRFLPAKEDGVPVSVPCAVELV